MYQVRFLDEAIEDLKRLDKLTIQRIFKKLKWVSENFENLKHERLSGDLEGFYKLRVGNYRIIYEVLFEEKIIIIHAVGHRREFYKIS